jgi:hypothetical protein
MILRQKLALQNRSSHPMMYLRYCALVVALIHAVFIMQKATPTTTAFHIHDSTYRRPIRRNFVHRPDTSFMTVSSMARPIMLPKSILSKDHIFSLNLAKNRVGLEQKRESATPTGANDSIIVFIYCIYYLRGRHVSLLDQSTWHRNLTKFNCTTYANIFILVHCFMQV